MKHRIDLRLAALALVLVSAQLALSNPGTLDDSFGSGGLATTSRAYFRTSQDNLGRTLLATMSGFTVTRLNVDGTLDTSFGNAGIAQTSVGESGQTLAVAVQPDGKVILVGATQTEGLSRFAVVRFNAQGVLDQTFGAGGIVVTDWGPLGAGASSVGLQPDGKIVVAGVGGSPVAAEFNDPLIARYDQRGNLDPSFGTNGRARLNRLGDDHVFSLALLPNGKIILGGHAYRGAEGRAEDFSVVRLNPNGSPDSSFSNDGFAETPVGPSEDKAWSVAAQADGKVVLGGYCFTGERYQLCLARFDDNGDLDTAFGMSGRIIAAVNLSSEAESVHVQRNGKIVAVGTMYNGTGSRAAVLRLNADGTPDSGFGSAGMVLGPHIGNLDVTFGHLQGDGKIVVNGRGGPAVGWVLRYHGDSVEVPNKTRFDFDGDARADYSVFRPSTGTWYWSVASGFGSGQFGLASDTIVPADFDGDRRSDLAVYRNGLWYVLRSSDLGVSVVNFGLGGDKPVPADYDGDGNADPAVFRDGAWYILNSSNGSFRVEQFGVAGDDPIVADFDGDARSDITVFRAGTWYVNGSFNGFSAYQFGLGGDRPVVGDYDGDHVADFAVYRDGVWYLQQSSAGFTAMHFGIETDRPLAADFDGDLKDDIAVYRDGIWWVSKSTGGVATYSFGLPGDIPVPTAFLY